MGQIAARTQHRDGKVSAAAMASGGAANFIGGIVARLARQPMEVQFFSVLA
jgi:hypothetical protein